MERSCNIVLPASHYLRYANGNDLLVMPVEKENKFVSSVQRPEIIFSDKLSVR